MLSKTIKMLSCLALAFCVVSFVDSTAAPLIYEPFDYALGSLSGKGPAQGFTSAWSGGILPTTVPNRM